jgi:hypothetical protein
MRSNPKLASMLRERRTAGRSVRFGQFGAGNFRTLFLSRARLTLACTCWGSLT